MGCTSFRRALVLAPDGGARRPKSSPECGRAGWAQRRRMPQRLCSHCLRCDRTPIKRTRSLERCCPWTWRERYGARSVARWRLHVVGVPSLDSRFVGTLTEDGGHLFRSSECNRPSAIELCVVPVHLRECEYFGG